MTAGADQLRDVLAVVLTAAAPLSELRGSIPLALAGLKMPLWEALFWSLLGNALPIFLIYALGGWWLELMERHRGFWARLTDRVLGRTRRKFDGKYERYGLLALTLFVAVPLPVTGVWTGTLAAFIFGIPLKKAWPYLVAGLLIAATVVTLLTTGALTTWRLAA